MQQHKKFKLNTVNLTFDNVYFKYVILCLIYHPGYSCSEWERKLVWQNGIDLLFYLNIHTIHCLAHENMAIYQILPVESISCNPGQPIYIDLEEKAEDGRALLPSVSLFW